MNFLSHSLSFQIQSIVIVVNPFRTALDKINFNNHMQTIAQEMVCLCVFFPCSSFWTTIHFHVEFSLNKFRLLWFSHSLLCVLQNIQAPNHVFSVEQVETEQVTFFGCCFSFVFFCCWYWQYKRMWTINREHTQVSSAVCRIFVLVTSNFTFFQRLRN